MNQPITVQLRHHFDAQGRAVYTACVFRDDRKIYVTREHQHHAAAFADADQFTQQLK